MNVIERKLDSVLAYLRPLYFATIVMIQAPSWDSIRRMRTVLTALQSATIPVNVNVPSIGWCPVPFTMFPFSNVARNLVPFSASNVQVLMPLSISPLIILKEPWTLPEIWNQKPDEKGSNQSTTLDFLEGAIPYALKFEGFFTQKKFHVQEI